MESPAATDSPAMPGRAWLRLAGALSQLACGVCLLIGTIGLVLVQQSKVGSLGGVAVWLAAAMLGLIFGGLAYRGGLISLLGAAAIDATLGGLLIALDGGTLRRLLRILPASDVELIGQGLGIAGGVMLGAAGLCLIAIPQGRRFSRWFRDAAQTRTARTTARGFPPPPVAAYTATYVIPEEDDPGSRRRLYMVLGGVAIGVGAGVGVLVSSTQAPPAPVAAAPSTAAGALSREPPSTGPRPRAAAAIAAVTPSTGGAASGTVERPATAPTDAGAAPPTPDPVAGATTAATSPAPAGPATVQLLVSAQRDAIARGDVKALADLTVPGVFGFGIDADEAAEGRALVAAQLARDVGDPPAGGFTVTARGLSIGEDRGHAWIAEELDVTADDRPARRLVLSALAAQLDGAWRIVAMHWALPVADATAERLAILGTLPRPQSLGDRRADDAELDRAVRAAFASRAAFTDARSERPDAFNFGSGGERARGASIKRIFSKLKAQLRVRDGVRVADGATWDPAQRAGAWIGWAALNVDYTARTRAATEVTQTFRVLAIFLKEGAGWRIVQTHWSNGGPIRE